MSDRKSVESTVKKLRNLFEREQLGPEDQLKPERVLAEKLGCSRGTIREALRQLENEGIIWRHQGKGTFIGSAPMTVDRPVHRILESASTSELIEARLVFEPALAEAAADLATERDIEELEMLAAATGGARDWREYERFDDAFHKAIARSCGNPLLMAIFATLASVRGRARWQKRHLEVFRAAKKEEYSAQQGSMHRAVVSAIKSRDGTKARTAMQEHLVMIRSLLDAQS